MKSGWNVPEVYRQAGRISYTVVGVYLFLILVALLVVPHSGTDAWALVVIVVLFVFFLGRYLSTRYSIDDMYLGARRVAGPRRVPLESIRQIEYSSLRDLSPGGFVGSWGWRGRMWSPSIGYFDAIYTDPARGILVTGAGVPIYISPVHLEEFARELSRRARSYSGRLAVDVGAPSTPEPTATGAVAGPAGGPARGYQ